MAQKKQYNSHFDWKNNIITFVALDRPDSVVHLGYVTGRATYCRPSDELGRGRYRYGYGRTLSIPLLKISVQTGFHWNPWGNNSLDNAAVLLQIQHDPIGKRKKRTRNDISWIRSRRACKKCFQGLLPEIICASCGQTSPANLPAQLIRRK